MEVRHAAHLQPHGYAGSGLVHDHDVARGGVAVITIVTHDVRTEVPSLAPYLHRSLALGMTMDAHVMRAEDAATCRWIGYGIGKGVTHPQTETTVFGVPRELRSGLHAELVAGFSDVDPFPLCYDDRAHVFGFGGFVRWVYFADPSGGPGVFGLDWSIAARPTSGVAHAMIAVAAIARIAAEHGIPPDAELALLNWRMCEELVITALRERMALRTVADWNTRAPAYFRRGSGYCPRCGLRTLAHRERFCSRCGCDPARFWTPTHEGGTPCHGECSPDRPSTPRAPHRTEQHAR